eukprot:TRINITY_DN8707_c0_g1_i1.p1 TRINITY_DN8707_c0_g1~~TRINITY_DN8707_c0_g1_i1.p1  ORF type:complete len:151 (+),score=22.31 TRINITY_DN8707_c0_g1_i1:172-624(+)
MAGKGHRTPEPVAGCVFCCPNILDSNNILHQDEKVIAIQDIRPAAVRHYLVIPVEHISSVRDLSRSEEDYALVDHMYKIGHFLVRRDAPKAFKYRFGFHSPLVNSVDHLHLHSFALPYIPRWKVLKYLSYGPMKLFIEAEELLTKLKPKE